MKKLLLILLFPALAHAGTITTTGTLMNVTFASGTFVNTAAQTYTFKSSLSCNANTNTVSCAYSPSVTAHSLLLVGCIQSVNTNTMSVTDNNGNSYTAVTGNSIVNGTGGQRVGLFYTLNANAGATTVTCHETGNTATAVQVALAEYGTVAGGVFDVASSSVPTAVIANPGGAPLVTTATNELVFSFSGIGGGTVTGQSGTLRENYVNNYFQATEDQIAASVGSVTPGFTAISSGGSSWVFIDAAFK